MIWMYTSTDKHRTEDDSHKNIIFITRARHILWGPRQTTSYANTMAALGSQKGPLHVSHLRVSISLGFYLIKIVSVWYNKHSMRRTAMTDKMSPASSSRGRATLISDQATLTLCCGKTDFWWGQTWLLTWDKNLSRLFCLYCKCILGQIYQCSWLLIIGTGTGSVKTTSVNH